MKRALVCAVSAGLAIAQYKPDPEQGNELFDEQCSSCHHADRLETKVGPGLKWLYSKENVNDAGVLARINTGGKGMPAFKDSLSSEDKADLLAYLKTL